MFEPRPGDVVRARVERLAEVDGCRVATLQRRHADFRARSAWSFCDVIVALDAATSELRVGDEVEVVLAARAEAGRVADVPGNYSCRLHAAAEIPAIPIERSTERIYAGLIERSDPPASGDVVLHLGSGLTCYVELAGEGPFPPEAVEHGTFAEFILEEPLRAALLRKAAAKR